MKRIRPCIAQRPWDEIGLFWRDPIMKDNHRAYYYKHDYE